LVIPLDSRPPSSDKLESRMLARGILLCVFAEHIIETESEEIRDTFKSVELK